MLKHSKKLIEWILLLKFIEVVGNLSALLFSPLARQIIVERFKPFYSSTCA